MASRVTESKPPPQPLMEVVDNGNSMEEITLENMPCRRRCAECLNALYAKDNRKRDEQEGKVQRTYSNWIESIKVEKFEELLKSDAYCKHGTLDKMDEDGMTLLHRSILANRAEFVQLLIHNGANMNLTSRAGWSALHLAAFVGNSHILGLLKNESC